MKPLSTDKRSAIDDGCQLRCQKDDESLVSVIIPVYNAEGFLTRCIDSVLHQSYQPIEIILVDDGSVDGSPALVDLYASQYSQVVAYHQKNKGLSGARNAGIDKARGGLLFFLDSDDYIEPDEIESLYSAMVATGADLVVGGFVYENPDGQRGSRLSPEPGVVDERGFWHRAYFDSPGDYVAYVVSCGKLFKRTAFRRVRFDEGKLHEDEFIIHRLVAQCKRIAISDAAGYIYVQNECSISHNPSLSSYLDSAEAFLKRSEYFFERKWTEFVWGTLISSRACLANAACSERNLSDRERFDRAFAAWREAYRRLGSKGGGTIRNRVASLLFLVSPKLFSHVNKIWIGR